jgi:hypothetical protein
MIFKNPVMFFAEKRRLIPHFYIYIDKKGYPIYKSDLLIKA